MSRYAIINTTSGLVENEIEYAAPPGNPPPGFASGYIAVQDDTSSIGWSYSNGVLSPPPAPVPTAAQVEAAAKQAALQILQATDPELPRAVEDLIDALIAKGAIALTDLPAPAQARCAAKKAARAAYLAIN